MSAVCSTKNTHPTHDSSGMGTPPGTAAAPPVPGRTAARRPRSRRAAAARCLVGDTPPPSPWRNMARMEDRSEELLDEEIWKDLWSVLSLKVEDVESWIVHRCVNEKLNFIDRFECCQWYSWECSWCHRGCWLAVEFLQLLLWSWRLFCRSAENVGPRFLAGPLQLKKPFLGYFEVYPSSIKKNDNQQCFSRFSELCGSLSLCRFYHHCSCLLAEASIFFKLFEQTQRRGCVHKREPRESEHPQTLYGTFTA